MACAQAGTREGADEARGGLAGALPAAARRDGAEGRLLALPAPPAADRRLRRQPRGGAAGPHPRRPAPAPGRQRRWRRGPRPADRRDARRRARARASPTISPATASPRAAPSPARGCATSSRRSARPKGSHLLLVSHYDSTLRRARRGRRRHRRRHHARGRAIAARPSGWRGRSPSCSTRARKPGCSAPAPSSSAIRWPPRVDTAINLEARGVTGPAIMFETSRPNGPAIAALPRRRRPPGRQFALDRSSTR